MSFRHFRNPFDESFSYREFPVETGVDKGSGISVRNALIEDAFLPVFFEVACERFDSESIVGVLIAFGDDFKFFEDLSNFRFSFEVESEAKGTFRFF
jgi:hypothetical protein